MIQRLNYHQVSHVCMCVYLQIGSLQVGDSIDVKGPIGHVTYVGPGRLSLHKVQHAVNNLSLLCAGSGITPVPTYTTYT